MKVYVEYVLADNLFFDWTLLFLTAKVTKNPVKSYRLMLGAVVGSVGAVAVSLLSGVWGIVAKFCLFFALCVVAFGCKNLKKTALCALVFLFLTFALGGVIIGVFYFLKIDFFADATLVYFAKVPIGVIGLGCLLFACLLKAVVAECKKQKKLKRFGCKVSLTMFGNKIELQGLFDSGNSLTDGGLPVCFLCVCPVVSQLKQKICQSLIEGVAPKNMHYVDFVTVEGKAQTLVFEAEEFCIDGVARKSLLAFGNACGRDFDVLVNLYLTEEGV